MEHRMKTDEVHGLWISYLLFYVQPNCGDVTITGERLVNFALSSGPLSMAGSLSCHTRCDTGPRFFWSHPNDRPNQTPLTTRKGCGGSILTQILTGEVHGHDSDSQI